jgi:ATP-dependent Clp protease ATP-binding subunit ClpA
MQLANQSAQRSDHEYIDTEDIFMGIIKVGHGVGCAVLQMLNFDLNDLLAKMRARVVPGAEMVTMGKLPQTENAREVIRLAIDGARSLGDQFIGTEHLLLGTISNPNDLTAQFLFLNGLTPVGVMDAIRRVRSAMPQMATEPAAESTPLPLPVGYHFVATITEHAANASPFKAGEPVTLLSGGPDMTVLDIGIETGLVFCSWVNAYGKQEVGGWPAGALKKK